MYCRDMSACIIGLSLRTELRCISPGEGGAAEMGAKPGYKVWEMLRFSALVRNNINHRKKGKEGGTGQLKAKGPRTPV